jgi:polar amino acid transport system substrate-binding protein
MLQFPVYGLYLANGDKSMPKERLEIFGGEKIGVIHDFRFGEIFKNNKVRKIPLSGKGHKQEIVAFLDSVKNGSSNPISFESIYLSTLVTFKIIDSLSTGLPQAV